MAQQLPAIAWLGFSIDMTTITPNDITAVAAAVKQALQIIDVNNDNPRNVIIDGVTYSVPEDITVSTDVKEYQGDYVTFPTGTQASAAFRNDSSLFIRYLAVSGSPTAGYSIGKTFRSDLQFALYSYNSVHYSASLKNYILHLNEELLEGRVTRLAPFPTTGNTDATVLKAYRAFFDIIGTHVIVKAEYGARFQISSFASNADPDVNQKFSSDVLALYGGIPSKGDIPKGVVDEAQYQQFTNLQGKTLSTQGGDPDMGNTLANNPTSFDLYTKWTETNAQNPAVLNFSTVEVFTLMREAASTVLQDRADDVQNAFNYFVTHPQLYKTPVNFSIESDWAEFDLLVPSATIIPDPDHPFPDNTVASQFKIIWGKEYSHNQKRQTVSFLIINDGSPIDFSISHGSDGGGAGNGRASASLNNHEYINDKITDNNWNTMRFYQATVSDTPVTFNPSPAPRTWSETLRAYLEENVE